MIATAPPLILASASPRRSALLARAGVGFEVQPADVPEQARAGEAARERAARLAREKALVVARRIGAPRRWVLGADTLVVVDGEALGKPWDADHALALLRRLAGREHRVVTGVALAASDTLEVWQTTVETRVAMRAADDSELRAYVAGGEPLDKAGGYALQGEGRRFVVRIEGSESNVIGLPLEETLELLREVGAA